MTTGYTRPSDLEEAVAILAEHPHARPLAGGTDLMVQLRLGVRDPELVVDLRGLDELRELDGYARLGAAVTLRQVLASPVLHDRCTALVEAGDLLGGRQIQAAATLGGNLCNASPAAEMATPLLVHDAVVVAHGPQGQRRFPLTELWAGPGRTTLEAGELMVSLELPEPRGRSAYRRLELRRSVDIAVVGAAARLEIVDDEVVDARVAIGAVAPTPRRVPEAEAALVGATRSDLAEAFAVAARLAKGASQPIDDTRATMAYRAAMVEVMVLRSLEACAAPRPAEVAPA